MKPDQHSQASWADPMPAPSEGEAPDPIQPTLADDLQWLWEYATPASAEWQVRHEGIVAELAALSGERDRLRREVASYREQLGDIVTYGTDEPSRLVPELKAERDRLRQQVARLEYEARLMVATRREETRGMAALTKWVSEGGVPYALVRGYRTTDEAIPAYVAELRAEVASLREAMVRAVLPYEAIRMDDGSRKWIAPEIWKLIVESTEAVQTALSVPQREETK